VIQGVEIDTGWIRHGEKRRMWVGHAARADRRLSNISFNTMPVTRTMATDASGRRLQTPARASRGSSRASDLLAIIARASLRRDTMRGDAISISKL
jgi:hypothetical protein